MRTPRLSSLTRAVVVVASFTAVVGASRVAATEERGAPADFPADFPRLMDTGGFGAGEPLGGFGGDSALDRAGNRAALTRRPVVILHGNGTDATSAQWGVKPLAQALLAAGYAKSEIWAVSYLGANPGRAELPTPHRTNIDDVRGFIDAVLAYLGVDRVDLVTHSLGAGLGKGYMLGYARDGTFDPSLSRLHRVGTFVSLAAGHYGLGAMSVGEFQTGSAYERASHYCGDVKDDTPRGSADAAEQTGAYPAVTRLDDGAITYVALWATHDFVDMQNPTTGRLEGAHLNRAFDLGWGLPAHEAIIKTQAVVDAFVPYLDRDGTP